MSLLNRKSDVQRHLSSHGRKHPHLLDPATQPDATGFSGDGVTNTERIAPDPVLQSGVIAVSTEVQLYADGPASAVTPKPQA
jgi:hypothetical protein